MLRSILTQFDRLDGARQFLPDSRRVRIIWAICAVVIVAGVATTPPLYGSSSGMKCESVCSTFCPTNLGKYCELMGCGSVGVKCEDKVSCLIPYTFPKTIKCASPH